MSQPIKLTEPVETLKLKYIPAIRILYFLIAAFVGLIAASLIMGVLLRDGASTPMLRVAAVVQDIGVFILPAILTAIIVSYKPASLLAIDKSVDSKLFFLACLTYICATPALETVVTLNNSMTFPESMSGIEQWMREMEKAAGEQVRVLLGGDSVADLVVNILIVGVLAGFSEELFFRGGLQRLMTTSGVNPHIAIWVTAFIFSVFHMQFFGFFPRLLLGAFFGYLLLWSGSLWLPVSIHILNNSIVVACQWAGDMSDTPLTDGASAGGWNIALTVASLIVTARLIVLMSRRGTTHREC